MKFGAAHTDRLFAKLKRFLLRARAIRRSEQARQSAYLDRDFVIVIVARFLFRCLSLSRFVVVCSCDGLGVHRRLLKAREQWLGSSDEYFLSGSAGFRTCQAASFGINIRKDDSARHRK